MVLIYLLSAYFMEQALRCTSAQPSPKEYAVASVGYTVVTPHAEPLHLQSKEKEHQEVPMEVPQQGRLISILGTSFFGSMD